MKREYGFSRGVRGRFYRPRAKFRVPVYLDPAVEDYLSRISAKTGTDISTLVNRVLKKELEVHKALS